MRYYDPVKKQLIYLGKKADPAFWEASWQLDESLRDQVLKVKRTEVSKITRIFLKPQDGIILDGGCGIGKNVAALVHNGYQVIGLDYAPKIVQALNQYLPELDIRAGDVRKLPFADNYFTGYWSYGIIEHYREDYPLVGSEMYRVLKVNGFLFLGFPYMSPLRKLKARLGFYPVSPKEPPEGEFYQYLLNEKLVLADFQKLGFKLVKTFPYDEIKGIKDEISILHPLLQKLYDYQGNNFLIKLVRKAISLLFSPLAGHGIVLVLKKTVA